MAVSPLLQPLLLGRFEDNAALFRAIESLPSDAIAELMKGPVTGPHKRGECCRVCMAFDTLRDPLDDRIFAEYVTDEQTCTVTKLWDFHQATDLAEFGVEPGEGDVCFERCLLIYRAAGWKG